VRARKGVRGGEREGEAMEAEQRLLWRHGRVWKPAMHSKEGGGAKRASPPLDFACFLALDRRCRLFSP